MAISLTSSLRIMYHSSSYISKSAVLAIRPVTHACLVPQVTARGVNQVSIFKWKTKRLELALAYRSFPQTQL